jgi:hypothetical protein
MRLLIDKTWDAVPIDSSENVELEVGVGARDWTLEVDAPFHGDPPPEQAAGSCARLWTYEVVECMLVGASGHYLEVELGPHGHYLLLSFHGARNIVRQGMPARYEVAIERGRWHGRISVAAELVPSPILRLNAFALHGAGSARRYLCFEPLPGQRPDFHQIERYPAFRAPTDAAGGARAPGD